MPEFLWGKHTTPCEGETPPGKYSKWNEAIRQCNASFYDYADAFVWSQEWFTDDASRRATYEKYVPYLYRAAAYRHGIITRDYLGPQTKDNTAYAVLTANNELFVKVYGNHPMANEIYSRLVECDDLAIQARESLIMKRSRAACTDRFFSCVEVIIPVLTDDSFHTKPQTEKDGIVGNIDLFLKSARNYYTQAAARERQMIYLFGMLIGIVGLLFLLPQIAYRIADLLPHLNRDQVVGSMIAGAVGTMVSVLQRLTQQELTIDYEARGLALTVFGAARVILGALLALFVCVLLMSEILPIKIPPSDPPLLYFFWVFAFISGFSERFAQDMIIRTEKQITPGKGDKS